MKKLFLLTKSRHFITILTMVVLTTLIVVSCKKENIIKKTEPFSAETQLSKDVVASINGQVLQETGEPAVSVEVSIGNFKTNTDNDGNFYFENITAPEKHAHLIVKSEGNFTGHRTLTLTQGVAEYTVIRLMKKELSGTFDAVKGGEITAKNGGKITFASGSIMNAETKVIYNGNVNVYAKWIDPSGELLSEFMPGCLRGINTGNAEEMLETYGMFAVELFDESNNPLQILSGKTAEMKFPVPQAMQANAPSEMPMWYLDEKIGLWKEEGVLTKKGNEYIGHASHFSFWNADKPGYIGFGVTLHDSVSGTPLVQKYMKITRLINNLSSTGYTNGAGIATGQVPPNENLKLEVLHTCGG